MNLNSGAASILYNILIETHEEGNDMKYTDEQLEKMWEEFGDVLIDYDNPDYPDGIIDEDWFVFEAGTERMEIWHWFDEHYSKGVYKLMFKG